MKTKLFKKIVLTFLSIGVGVASILPSIAWAATVWTQAPSYENQFRNPLLDEKGVYDAKDKFNLDRTKSLKDNITRLFSPQNDKSLIWEYIKEIMIGITILFIAWAGIDFLLNTNNPAKLKSARMSLLYILAWGFLVYAAVWIVSSLFNLSGSVNPADELTRTLTQNIFFESRCILFGNHHGCSLWISDDKCHG